VSRHPRRTMLVAAVSTVAVIGFVVGAGLVLGRRSPTAAAAAPAGSSDVVDYGSGITTRPAPDAVPALTSTEAVTLATRIDMPRELMPGTPTTTLRFVTVDPGGAEEGGPPAEKLAWVLVYDGSPADLHGPVGLSRERRQEIAAGSRCSFIVILDARSGGTLALKQRCRER
jgi:hypothetical protein